MHKPKLTQQKKTQKKTKTHTKTNYKKLATKNKCINHK